MLNSKKLIVLNEFETYFDLMLDDPEIKQFYKERAQDISKSPFILQLYPRDFYRKVIRKMAVAGSIEDLKN